MEEFEKKNHETNKKKGSEPRLSQFLRYPKSLSSPHKRRSLAMAAETIQTSNSKKFSNPYLYTY